MRRILLVKTSSLGDIVHNLPVVADIRAALGDVAIDWVSERTFAQVPALHPNVRRVIPCAIRQWRRSWNSRATRAEWRAFVHALREETYDAIVDTQGLLKSAVVARIARGPRHGLDWRSSREPLRLFYDYVYRVPWTAHAVERNRRLCALALGYELAGPPVYGIRAERAPADRLPARTYVVLLHATSDPSKFWPEAHWVELGRQFAAAGCVAVLPWGDGDERVRADRLAAALTGALVPARMGLAELASVMAGAVAVIGVDTGLTHLAAALGVPVVGIYGVTDPSATGVYATGPVANVGSRCGFPDPGAVASAVTALGVELAPRAGGGMP